MFRLIWVFGFILHGAPNIQKMPAPIAPLEHEQCQAIAIQDARRMADWARGVLRQPLDFPVAVYGECEPVLRDATEIEH